MQEGGLSMDVALPDYVVTTGDFIEEWMEDEHINAAELSRRLGTSRKHVSQLLSGKASLSHSMALALERVTGIPSRIWNQYESGYRSALARRQENEALSKQYEQAKAFPLSYLRKWGFIKASARDKGGTVRELLSILRVANLDAFESTWAQGSVAYRRAAVKGDKSHALATWLALAETNETLTTLEPYDEQVLRDLFPELRRLTRDHPVAGLSKARELLRDCGVALELIPAVPGLGIHGATRWVAEHPVIQLSLLGKSDDQAWFTIFHEIGHVVLHSKALLFIEGKTVDEKAEDEANAFAADVLVPPARRDELPRTRNLEAVRSLAEELEIAPSIVLGQAQRMTGDFAWGHSLKRKVEFAEPHEQKVQ